MSMTMRTAFQIAWVLVCYTALTLTLPTMVFWRRLKHMGVAERFVFCVVTGNFWIIFAVLILLLLGISSVPTLLLLTYGLGLFVVCLRHRRKVAAGLQSFSNLVLWTLRGELRAGLLLHHAMSNLGLWLLGRLRVLGRWLRPRWIELLLLSVCLAGGLWFCSYQTLTLYSFGTSDLLVHVYWVNNMLDGTLYVSGVYPYGFHAILYFLAMLTGTDTLTLFRVFGPVQSVYIFLMLYLFVRKLCKCKYSAVISLIIFTLSSAFGYFSLCRYQFSLPQEYAMLFLYPAGSYLERYYRLYRRKRRSDLEFDGAALPEGTAGTGIAQRQYAHARKRNPFVRLWSWMREPKPMRNSTYLLVMFMLCLLLTLVVHFYVTIAAAFLCVAITLANLPGAFKPRPFFRLMGFVLLGVLIAVAPMALAYATGTKLEGSLRWGMSIISSYDSTTKETEQEPFATQIESPDLTSKGVQLGEKVRLTLKSTYQFIKLAVTQGQWADIAVAATLMTLAFSLLGLLVLRRKTYVRRWLGIVIYLALLILTTKYKELGYPALMELNRSSIFVAYALVALFAFPVDLLYCAIARWKKATRFCDSVVCLLCCALMLALRVLPAPEGGVGWSRTLSSYFVLQYPETDELLYDLYDNYPTEDWTLVSPVTETSLTYRRGWHYDLGLFILDQEDWDQSTIITIPTQYVFFLVEKRPFQYNQLVSMDAHTPLDKTEVSAESAALTLPDSSELTGTEVYVKYRTVVESKAYYWAEAFQKLYPYEMEVYFEDDSVICYRLTQNPAKLYNLAINYGYNAAPAEEATTP